MTREADQTTSAWKAWPSNSSHANLTDELTNRLENYRELIDCVQAIVWRADARTFQFTFVSGYAETLLGYPLQSWTAEQTFWEEHIYPEDREWVVARRNNAAKEGREYDLEYRLVASNGRALWVRELGCVLAGGSGTELAGVIVDLSQKRSAQRVLGEDKIWLRQVIDTIPQQIWSGPADGTLDFCNARWRSELGLSLEQLQGDGWQRMLHPTDSGRVLQAWHKSVTEGTPYEQEERHFLADGQYRWFLCRGVPLRDEHGKIVRWFGTNTDIQAQKQAEEALRNSENYLRQVIDTIPQQIWSATADGTLDFWNLRLLSDSGLRLEELRDDGWHKAVHPDDLEQVEKAWHESVITGTPYERQERLRVANREYHWFLGRAVPLRDERGNIVRWFGSSTDIDDQKRAEDALRTSEERWRALFENSSVGITLMDETGHFLVSNASFEKMVGYASGELRQMSYLDLTCEEDRANCEGLYADLWEGRSDRLQMEKRFCTKDRGLIWIRTNGSLVQQGVEAPFAVFIVEEITERKTLANQLQQERDCLRLLLDLGHRFLSKLEIREFFNALLDGLRSQAGWDWATILLHDAESSRLDVYLSPANAYLREGDTIPIESSLQGQVYRSGKPVTFRIEELPALCAVFRDTQRMQDIVRREGVKAGCALPLIREGHVIGVLLLMTRSARDPAKNDLNFLEELASLVASSLSNTLQFDRANASRLKLVSEKKYIEDEVRREGGFEGILGESTALRDVLQQVDSVAPTDSSVLILGESGTGKELIARAIHDRSPRRDQSFIKVDIPAIPANLLESELFGHEKGAFTGAIAQKLGRFEAADQGTLFLDEVGDIPLELQPKLLRVLQDHAFERLGSNRLRHVNVRIIAATNRNLEAIVEDGKFREDLYYRLKVFPITIPPLRERPADIPPLVHHFVAKYVRRMKKDITTIPVAAMDMFMRYPWPGNVRELQHFMERSVVISRGRVLEAPLAELERTIERQRVRTIKPAVGRTLEEIERESILQALRESNWVIGGPDGAAAKLGVKRTTLASRMERLGISRRRSG